MNFAKNSSRNMKYTQVKTTPKFGTQRQPRTSTLEENSGLGTGADKDQA
jgi:hypothetical protein